jgi:predicted RNase H-like nuclease
MVEAIELIEEQVIVVGVDVGGPRKGFHAVALRDTAYLDRTESCSPEEIFKWCQTTGAKIVAVDAPCCWSSTGKARAAECALAAMKIFSFATPARENAVKKPFYQWMLSGAALYTLLQYEFPLFRGVRRSGRMCIETFPQAVACALAGMILSAKKKKENRLEVLRSEGLDTRELSNIDYIDAALCALAALYMYRDRVSCYGNPSEGFIVVPKVEEPRLRVT